MFSQSVSKDSLIKIHKINNLNPEVLIKLGEEYAAEKDWEKAIYYSVSYTHLTLPTT